MTYHVFASLEFPQMRLPSFFSNILPISDLKYVSVRVDTLPVIIVRSTAFSFLLIGIISAVKHLVKGELNYISVKRKETFVLNHLGSQLKYWRNHCKSDLQAVYTSARDFAQVYNTIYVGTELGIVTCLAGLN